MSRKRGIDIISVALHSILSCKLYRSLFAWFGATYEDPHILEKCFEVHHWEVAVRITIASFVGYCFAIAAPPVVVPKAFASFIGFLAPLLSMMFPTFIMGLGKMIPVFMFVMIVATISATAILAASWKGTGAYVAVFSFFILIVSRLRFGKGTGNLVVILIVSVLNLTMGTYLLVQEEGLSIVGKFWTSSGLQNPMAMMPNFLIAFAWALAIASCPALLPPWRTSRKSLSRGLFPTILMTCVDALRAPLIQQRTEKGEGKEKQAEEGKEEGEIPSSNLTKTNKRDELVHLNSVLMGGSVAGLTAYEPRLLRCKPPECSWKILKDLAVSIEKLIVKVLAFGVSPEHILVHEGAEERLEQVANELEVCAKALAEQISMEQASDQLNQKQNINNNGQKRTQKLEDPAWFTKSLREIRHATNAWLAVMDTPGTQLQEYSWCSRTSWQNLIECISPWIMPSIAFLLSIWNSFVTLFYAQTWKAICVPPHSHLRQAWWCVKFTFGFVALLCMVAYWDAFREFDVPTGDNNVEATHYAGWAIVAYGFATTQTVEGTFKKGVLRLVGTCFGAFSGWLAWVVLDKRPHLEIGLVAWMTATTFLFTFFATERGPMGYMGLSADYAWFNIYFVMTQAVIVFNVYHQSGSRDEITVNRIVGNITGILMAMILGAIPPTIEGGNPCHVRLMVNEVKDAMVNCLRLLLEKDGEALKLHKPHLVASYRTLHETARDYMKDAARMSVCPVYKVDPNLHKISKSVNVTASVTWMLLSSAVHIVENDEWNAAFDEGTRWSTHIKHILEELDGESDTKPETAMEVMEGGGESEIITNSGSEKVTELFFPELYVQYAMLVMKKIKEHESDLSNVQWGFVSRK